MPETTQSDDARIKTDSMNSDVYKRHHGHRSDFEGPNSECANCGVSTYNAPDVHPDAHSIQMQYPTPAGDTFCEACYFDSYDRTGFEIADPEMRTFYKVIVDGRRLFLESHQAAVGVEQRIAAAEYKGARKIAPAKLEAIDA